MHCMPAVVLCVAPLIAVVAKFHWVNSSFHSVECMHAAAKERSNHMCFLLLSLANSSDTPQLFVSCGCKHGGASMSVTNLCFAGGFAFGYWASRIAGLPEKAARTNSIEVMSLLHCVTICRHLLLAGNVLPVDNLSACC